MKKTENASMTKQPTLCIIVLFLSLCAPAAGVMPRDASKRATPGAAAPASDGRPKARAGSGVPDVAETVRRLRQEAEDLQKKADPIPVWLPYGGVTRYPWQTERAVELSAKAKKAGVQRNVLESLTRSAAAISAPDALSSGFPRDRTHTLDRLVP